MTAAAMLARPPSPEIIQWDYMACEAACTAQILYMHGLLDASFSRPDFDRRIGRKRGCADLRSGNLELLLESGIEVRAISPVDPHRLLESIDYVRGLWLEDGDTPAFIDKHLPAAYPSLCSRTRRGLEIAARYASRFSREVRGTTWADLTMLLDGGYLVACERESESGNSHMMLATRHLAPGMFEVYVPDCGVIAYGPDLASSLLPGFYGYRLGATP